MPSAHQPVHLGTAFSNNWNLTSHLRGLTEIRAELNLFSLIVLEHLVFLNNTSERKHNWLAFINPKLDMLILIKPEVLLKDPQITLGLIHRLFTWQLHWELG